MELLIFKPLRILTDAVLVLNPEPVFNKSCQLVVPTRFLVKEVRLGSNHRAGGVRGAPGADLMQVEQLLTKL